MLDYENESYMLLQKVKRQNKYFTSSELLYFAGRLATATEYLLKANVNNLSSCSKLVEKCLNEYNEAILWNSSNVS